MNFSSGNASDFEYFFFLKREINKEVWKAPTNIVLGFLLTCIIALDEIMKPLE